MDETFIDKNQMQQQSLPSSYPTASRRESKSGMTSFSGDEGGGGGLDRLDSLDEYFLINSPPESPDTQRQTFQPTHMNNQQQQQQQPSGFYGYYAGPNSNIASTQDNARLSTSNIAVDRSNSVAGSAGRRASVGSARGFMNSSSQQDVDDLLKDFNFSELFLGTPARHSLNRTYETAGALTGHDKDLHRNRSLSFSSMNDESDNTSDNVNRTGGDTRQSTTTTTTDNAKRQQTDKVDKNDGTDELSLEDLEGVEPTPLSEIRRKAQGRKRMRDQQIADYGDTSTSTLNQITSPQQSNPKRRHTTSSESTQQTAKQQNLHVSSYYPFGRSYQLPIPTMPLATGNNPAEPGNANSSAPVIPPNLEAAALATAAAIANHQSDIPKQMSNPPHSPQIQSAGQHQLPLATNNHIRSPATHSPAPNTTPPSGPVLPQQTQLEQHHSGHHPHSQPPGSHYPHYHQYAHQHHSTNPTYPLGHTLTTPLAAGPSSSMPTRVVGPYTTAQQRTVSNSSSNADKKGKASKHAGGSYNTNAAPAPAASYLPRRGDHTTREAAAAHTTPKGVLMEAAKQRRGYPHSQHKYSGIPSSAAPPSSSATTMAQQFPSQVLSRNGSTNQSADTAYERKKQVGGKFYDLEVHQTCFDSSFCFPSCL